MNDDHHRIHDRHYCNLATQKLGVKVKGKG